MTYSTVQGSRDGVASFYGKSTNVEYPFLLYLWGDPSFWPQVPHGSKRWDRFECTIFPNKASTHDLKFVLLLCLFTWLDNFLFLSQYGFVMMHSGKP